MFLVTIMEKGEVATSRFDKAHDAFGYAAGWWGRNWAVEVHDINTGIITTMPKRFPDRKPSR